MTSTRIAPQIERLRLIQKRGTSAHLQLELYRTLLKIGRPHRQALFDVAKWLRASTEAGDFVAEDATAPSIASMPPNARAKSEERTQVSAV